MAFGSEDGVVVGDAVNATVRIHGERNAVQTFLTGATPEIGG